MTNIQFIARTVQTAAINIQKTVQLLEEDCTIPFISRYRKDTTGNLDEVVIEQIAKLQKEYETIVKRVAGCYNDHIVKEKQRSDCRGGRPA